MLSNGAFYETFEAYPGSITDPKQVELSGFLDLLDEGIDVMVDKGFLIQEMVEGKRCICWMPPKMGDYSTQIVGGAHAGAREAGAD